MTYDASDRKAVRRAEKASKLAETQSDEVIVQIMANVAGRSWMHDLLASCHIFSTPFTRDPIVTGFRCGEHNIGIQLFTRIVAICPDQYIQMMREANARSTVAERRSSPNPGGDAAESTLDDSIYGDPASTSDGDARADG